MLIRIVGLNSDKFFYQVKECGATSWRLYETALNTNEAESDTIAAMAERIDFWINELRGGDTNG